MQLAKGNIKYMEMPVMGDAKALKLILCCALSLNAWSVQASDLSPFSIAHPSLDFTSTPKSQTLSLGYQIANTQYYKVLPNHRISVDTQTQLTNIVIGGPLSDRWSYQISASYALLSGGFSDNFIETWHSVFGLPNGSRDQYLQNLMRIQYERNDEVLVAIHRSVSGLLDTQAALQFELDDRSSVNVFVNLPTGNGDQLLGSEKMDLGLAWQHTYINDSGWRIQGRIGVLALGDGGLLRSESKSFATFGHLGLAYPLSEVFSVRLWLDSHTAYYDSPLAPLGKDTLILGMGGALAISDRWQLDLFVSEDIAVEASPDVGLHMRLTWRAAGN